MQLNLNDPKSIVAWYQVHPAVHGAQLETFARMWPQFRRALTAARELIEDAHSHDLEVAAAAEAAMA
nr:hypothetical protein [uncultured Roseateles sp.]